MKIGMPATPNLAPGVWALSHDGRIGTHKGWGDGRRSISSRSEIHRDVVSLEAPGPGSVLRGADENVELVVLRITSIRSALDQAEYPFELHHSGRLQVALGAENTL